MISLPNRKNNVVRSVRCKSFGIQIIMWRQLAHIQKQHLFKVFFCLLIGTAILQVSPLLAADTGRLFTTAAQRMTLQRLRNDVTKKKIEAQQKEQDSVTLTTTVPKSKPIDTIYLRGIVYRADGKHQVWISEGNTLTTLPQMEDHIEKIEPDRLYFSWPNKKTQQIKTGEYLDLQTDN